jgi:electron transport complex protein RnfC
MRELTLERRLLGGLRLTAHKQDSTRQPVRRGYIPRQLILPLALSPDREAVPLVTIGDRVLRGQVVARSETGPSETMHASTSGHVSAIESWPVAGPPGSVSSAIVIRADGLDEATPFVPMGKQQLDPITALNRVRDAGIVGLGGALYPTDRKLKPVAHELTLILNGAECEPYISCDDMLMREQSLDVVAGALLMCDLSGASRCIVAIERDKPDAIARIISALETISDARIELAQVPTVYPAGGERQLIQLLTGIEIPSGRYPTDVGFICQNVATAVALHHLYQSGEPLISRIVTVTGKGVAQPQNIKARIGTPIAELIELAGGYGPQVSRLIMGGSMMGLALPTDAIPVTKATNCIVAATRDEVYAAGEERPCIRCGDCAAVCPARLLPQELIRSLKAGDPAGAAELALSDCIECGCCDVVCPSHIPLTQAFRQGKHDLALLLAQRTAASRAEQRIHERTRRLSQQAADEAGQRQALQDAVRGDAQSRRDAVREVLARAAQAKPDSNSDGSD